MVYLALRTLLHRKKWWGLDDLAVSDAYCATITLSKVRSDCIGNSIHNSNLQMYYNKVL